MYGNNYCLDIKVQVALILHRTDRVSLVWYQLERMG